MPAPSERARRKARVERDPTERIVGVAAARAVFEVRPEDVLHVAHSPAARGEIGGLLREAARRRIAYRELPDEELAKMAGSLHHEGICVLAKARPSVQLADLTRALAPGGFVLALDQVANPHNVGALLRTAAYFGAAGLLVGHAESGARADPRAAMARGLGPAAVRIAEGGAEYVPVCFVRELATALEQLASAGAAIVGADAHEGEPLGTVELTDKSVLVVGNERSGLSPAVQKRCTRRVRITGRGFVESLNVSVAAGILLAHAAQHMERTR
jgi:TrmH RNA methyltransferase